MIRSLRTDFSFVDDRGEICQILSVPCRQVNYLYTKAGAKRGRHYHKQNREIFYVISGEVKIQAQAVGKADVREEGTFSSGDAFLVEPYAIHDLTFLRDTQMVVVYDVGVEQDGQKDIFEG